MHGQRGIEDLLNAAKSGDKEAENQLFSKLCVRILALVKHRIWNTQMHASEIQRDAEDLAQDIYCIILQKYKTETFEYGFLRWVFGIVQKKIGTYFRQHDRKLQKEVRNLDEEKLYYSNGPDWPEKLLESEELDKMITRALKKLRSRCQAIIKALLQGEIKAYIKEQRRKTRLKTIYVHIHRCRKRFINLLLKEGFKR